MEHVRIATYKYPAGTFEDLCAIIQAPGGLADVFRASPRLRRLRVREPRRWHQLLDQASGLQPKQADAATAARAAAIMAPIAHLLAIPATTARLVRVRRGRELASVAA